MTALCKVLTITKPTSNGAQAYTGVGFTPKVLILTAGKTTVDSTIDTTFAFEGHGFATASQAMSLAAASATTVSGGPISGSSIRDAHCIHFINGTNSDLGKAALTSMDSDGFTLTWSNVDANAYIINVMALGGSDLSNAKIMSFTKPTGAGPNDYTGFGFDPTAIIILHPEAITAIPSTTNVFYCASKGYGDSASNEWSITQLELGSGSGSSAAVRGNKTSNIWAYINSIGTFSYEGNLSAYISDGFRIATTTTNGTAGKFICLGLRGFQTKAGVVTKNTSAAPVTQAVTGTGFRPIGVITANDTDPNANTSTADIAVSHGMTDGTTDLCNSSGLRDSQTAVPGRNRTKNTVSAHVGDRACATAAEANITMDSDGFTFHWSTNNGIAHQLGYFAIGPATSPVSPATTRASVVW